MTRTGLGGGTGVAIGLTTVGGIMVYSAFKGISITDVLASKTGDTLDPHGSAGGVLPASETTTTDPTAQPGDLAQGGKWTAPPGGAASFKGPHAALLDDLAGVAQNQFHLRISATTNGGHVFDSYHYRGRAFDAAGTEANMRAFAQYVHDHFLASIAELIHNPGYAIKDGVDVSPLVFIDVWAGHKDHVHVAA